MVLWSALARQKIRWTLAAGAITHAAVEKVAPWSLLVLAALITVRMAFKL
jgi:hypothetical protein